MDLYCGWGTCTFVSGLGFMPGGPYYMSSLSFLLRHGLEAVAASRKSGASLMWRKMLLPVAEAAL